MKMPPNRNRAIAKCPVTIPMPEHAKQRTVKEELLGQEQPKGWLSEVVLASERPDIRLDECVEAHRLTWAVPYAFPVTGKDWKRPISSANALPAGAGPNSLVIRLRPAWPRVRA